MPSGQALAGAGGYMKDLSAQTLSRKKGLDSATPDHRNRGQHRSHREELTGDSSSSEEGRQRREGESSPGGGRQLSSGPVQQAPVMHVALPLVTAPLCYPSPREAHEGGSVPQSSLLQ